MIIVLFVLGMSAASRAQFTDRYWCFGDSAGIDFSNLTNPVSGHSVLRARGTCASISDSSGNLLFYAGSPYTPYWLSGINQMGYIISKNDSIMQNGDSLKSSLWYQEMVITPNPGNINQFYVFHIGVTSTTNPGLYYSIVDLSYNSGLGRVIQKNVQLQNVEMCDGLTAVKHGNGKEWWLIAKRWDSLNNEFILYRITINGIIGPTIQNVGTPTSIGFLRIEFSNDGENIAVVNYGNLIELYHFDRCTGQITINHTVENEYLTGPYPGLWSCAFSVDNSKLYVTSILNGQNQDSSYLFQYDLNATNISASKDTLHTFISPSVAGILQLGPDARLYLSCSMEINDCEFAYLYCDTSYFPQNMNLSVINYPDSLGAACNFQPYSFYLGGHRTYYGLPNNPNYELGPWANSICDTLGVGIHELIATDEQRLYISPNPTKDIIWVNAQKLKGKKSQVVVRDILGQELFRKIEIVYGGYLSTNLDLSLFPDAVYLVTVETEKEKIVQRVVKD